MKITWKVDNPDQDELRYRLYYRLDSQTTWRSVLKPAEKLSKTEYDWDVSALPSTFILDADLTTRLAIEREYDWDRIDVATLIENISKEERP